MFERITEKLQDAVRTLRGLGSITEKNITGALAEVRDALLDADVSFTVVKSFLETVARRALGEKVARSIAPGQLLVKIIHDSLVELFGEGTEFCEERPLHILLVGLQGSGKTTSTVKLAKLLARNGYVPLAVACDLQRPAAVEQLEQLAAAESIACFSDRSCRTPVDVARAAMRAAEKSGANAILFDTAGRLQLDGPLVEELVELQRTVVAQEILLVADGALGQEAVAVAQGFHGALGLTGILLTKMDGDARGGAALSMKHTSGVPIKFFGTGEHADDLEVFHAERMARRILGLGDVVSLVERAQERVDRNEADRLSKRFKKAEFDFNDFLSQMEQVDRMGSMANLVKMLPGMASTRISARELSLLDQTKAIIRAMTAEERCRPHLVAGNRKLRIAKGSGVALADVNHVLKQFEQMKKSIKLMKKPQGKKLLQQMSTKGAMEQMAKLFGGK
ncbi:MAG: signal recognition particle protein [Puniceicoccales bacterium]|jgi:signal recognition particle subunit SRP54|nr:signal recognition particle protein [Puniceicoccales bacterium]